MNKKLMLLLVPVLVVVIGVYVLRSVQSKPKAAALPGSPSSLLTMHTPSTPAPASKADAEHELKALQEQLKKKSDHVPVLLRLAQLSRDGGKMPDSIKYLRDALTQDSKNAEARLELGRSLFDTGDVEGAIRETELLLQSDPTNVDALYNLGAIYGNMGNDGKAREYWTRAIAAGPETDSGRRAKQNMGQLKPAS